MQSLLNQVKSLEKTEVNNLIENKLKEFKSFENKTNEEWFSELCFCILTANSRASTAIAIQKELGPKGFLTKKQKELAMCILKNKHRFYNNKSKYILEARKYKDIRNKIRNMSENEAREWIVNNIKGIGYKEASHFLRNTGKLNLAILDRHIINLMIENNIIEKPKTLTKKNYEQIEQKFNNLSKEVNMSPAKLDMFMWYLKTGEVLK